MPENARKGKENKNAKRILKRVIGSMMMRTKKSIRKVLISFFEKGHG
jgi:hypothetical protein